MDEFNELLENAILRTERLMELLEDAKSHPHAHEASFEDILYELSEVKSSIEDQLES